MNVEGGLFYIGWTGGKYIISGGLIIVLTYANTKNY